MSGLAPRVPAADEGVRTTADGRGVRATRGMPLSTIHPLSKSKRDEILNTDAQLIQRLRRAQTHLLPSELAAEIGISLAELETALARLRGAEFEIETRPGFGCRLLAAPDRIIADDLHSRLGECALAREILVFEETSSTNDVAMQLGRQGHAGRLAVFAERQTAGRGRFGRRWDSSGHEGLWFSLLLRVDWPLAHWPRLTTWAGVALAAAVEKFTALPARLKWPNDLLVSGRKVAGILTESASDASGAMFAVIGIGLNVNQTDFPPDLPSAASLRQLTGRLQDRPALAAAVLSELATRLPQAANDFPQLIAEASQRSAVLGTWVRLHAGGIDHEGTAESIDPDGSLLLRIADGSLHRMIAGEVTSALPR